MRLPATTRKTRRDKVSGLRLPTRNPEANSFIQGGSLGWKSKGDLDPKFEEVAFVLEPSTTAKPKFVEVKTGFGYHVVMVWTDWLWCLCDLLTQFYRSKARNRSMDMFTRAK